MYKTILVPLDGSTRAERILPHVEELALAYSATVVFLQVIEVDSSFVGHHNSLVKESFQVAQRLEKDAQSYLKEMKGEFRAKGIDAKARIEHGDVVKTIIKIAELEGVDLIAMASHGHGGIQRLFYGSVASGVLHRIDRPLLLVRSR